MGLWDAESHERHWAYLGKFASLTMGMTHENRAALLSSANKYATRKVFGKLGKSCKINMLNKLIQE